MAEVRALTDADLPEVAALQDAAFRGRSGGGSPGLQQYLRHVFLEHPWQDLGLHSLVKTGADGRIVGFLGVVPRPMRLRGRLLKVAVCHRLAALPGARDPMIGLHLLRTLFAGPQDLAITDSSNRQAWAAWQSLRGSICIARSLTWTRISRPVANWNRFVAGRPLLRALTLPLRAVTRPLDALAVRNVRSVARATRPAHLEEVELSDARLLEHGEAAWSRLALHPVYDQHSLAWLLRCLRDNHERGTFRAILLRDARGAVAGWFLYYGNRDGVSEVLQLHAVACHATAVVEHLLWRCQEEGAVAVRGRFEGAMFDALTRHRVRWSMPDGSWTLVHSRDPEIAAALHSGDAWLTALEGELWLRSPRDDLSGHRRLRLPPADAPAPGVNGARVPAR